MRKLLLLPIIGFILLLSSCRKDFTFEPLSSNSLEFSKDTVYLDTVFTNIGSSTYRLKVYNRSNKDISIPKIQLGKGTSSKYRMMIDGKTGDANAQGKVFSNVELMAKDSLYIFIEVTADVASANPTDFLYTDQIQFYNTGGSFQKVELVTLIQDAYFIYPSRTPNSSGGYDYEQLPINFGTSTAPEYISGSNLDAADPVNGDEFNFKTDKPYVIYGYALVPDGKTLTIPAGARVHFHANSGLMIARDGRLVIAGTNPPLNSQTDLSNEVIFQGDRLEPSFEDVPGQWGAILSFSTRTDNSISHLTLKNAVVGLYISPFLDTDVPNMNITQSQIYNCSNIGILGRNAKITGNNLAMNYFGQASLACTFGGDYSFTNCTFNNDWNSSSQSAVVLNDYYETSTTRYINDTTKNYLFNNCIIYGSSQNELFIEKKGAVNLNYQFNNCLIKFNNTSNNTLYPIANTTNYNSDCKIATNNTQYNPKYKSTNKNQMWPTEDLSFIISNAAFISTDILGKNRTSTSNIGAYNTIAN